MDLFENMDILLKAFWFIAIPTSLIFIIQTIMTFIGTNSNADIEHPVDAELPFQFFTFRNLINFLLGFSWTGISFFTTISNQSFLVFLSLIVGGLFVYLFFIVIGQIQNLAEDNSFRLVYTLDKTAEVYLTIPENKSGKGKIMISINGSFHELEAMTENEKIQSGALVKVIRIENQNILIVEKI